MSSKQNNFEYFGIQAILCGDKVNTKNKNTICSGDIDFAQAPAYCDN